MKGTVAKAISIKGTVSKALAGLHKNITAFTGDDGLPNLGLLSISFQQSLVFFPQLLLSEDRSLITGASGTCPKEHGLWYHPQHG